MRRFASLVAIFMLLSAAAPLLACVSGPAMSKEEGACCRTMHGNCSGMAKMGCCRTEARTDAHPPLAASSVNVNAHFAVVNWLLPSFAEMQHSSFLAADIPDAHSPPGLIAARTTVLRI